MPEFADYPEDSPAELIHRTINQQIDELQKTFARLRSTAHTKCSHEAAARAEFRLSEIRVLLNTEYDFAEPTAQV